MEHSSQALERVKRHATPLQQRLPCFLHRRQSSAAPAWAAAAAVSSADGAASTSRRLSFTGFTPPAPAIQAPPCATHGRWLYVMINLFYQLPLCIPPPLRRSPHSLGVISITSTLPPPCKHMTMMKMMAAMMMLCHNHHQHHHHCHHHHHHTYTHACTNTHRC